MNTDAPETEIGQEKRGKPSPSSSAGAATMASQVGNYLSSVWKEVQIRTGLDPDQRLIYGTFCMLFFVWLIVSASAGYGIGFSFILMGAAFSIWNSIISLCIFYKIRKGKDLPKTQ